MHVRCLPSARHPLTIQLDGRWDDRRGISSPSALLCAPRKIACQWMRANGAIHNGFAPLAMGGFLVQVWREAVRKQARSEEHTSELQSLMRTSYAVFCLQKTRPTLTTALDLLHP